MQTDLDALGRLGRSGWLAGAPRRPDSVLEPAEATADVVAHLAEQVGAPALYVSSSCELEFLPTPVAEQKVARLGEVAALLKERLAMTVGRRAGHHPASHPRGRLARQAGLAGQGLAPDGTSPTRTSRTPGRGASGLGVPDYEDLLLILAPPAAQPRGEGRASSGGPAGYGLRLEESAGLDVVYDGEQQRSEMYAWAVAHANGFDWRGSVRAFDNKYYSKAAVTGPISLRSPVPRRGVRASSRRWPRPS